MKNVRQGGFTLVELLISLGILGLLLAAVVSVNVGTSRSAAGLQTRNDLQPELQIVQNYIPRLGVDKAHIVRHHGQ
ncbi:prepilin-type N-terminal cleavage/methylation domain-containing protein [Deinococcus radiomollis]|uniref:prepilin-type N-terminal cleavage/methylation domain-containing protein n=1 Tax=Deinococcus radiomollis TaxID=468916 RepID=UPI00389299B1